MPLPRNFKPLVVIYLQRYALFRVRLRFGLGFDLFDFVCISLGFLLHALVLGFVEVPILYNEYGLGDEGD